MQDWSTLITALGSILVALGGRELIVGWLNKRSGRAAAEGSRIRETLDDNEKLRDDIDKQRAKLEHQYSINRIIKEYASVLRRILIDKGVPVAEIPDWPNER